MRAPFLLWWGSRCLEVSGSYRLGSFSKVGCKLFDNSDVLSEILAVRPAISIRASLPCERQTAASHLERPTSPLTEAYRVILKKTYKSIKSLHCTEELPMLTLLTGPNGVGKSHLLQALANSSISTEWTTPHRLGPIRLFDWNSFFPNSKDGGGPVSHEDTSNSTRQRLFREIEVKRVDGIHSFPQFFLRKGLPSEWGFSYEKAVEVGLDDILPHINGDKDLAKRIHAELRAKLAAQNSICATPLRSGSHGFTEGAAELLKSGDLAFLLASESELFGRDEFLLRRVDMISLSFAKVFQTYRSLLQKNAILRSYPSAGHQPLTDAEFELRYGSAPWKLVNMILDTCNLGFEIESPPLHDRGNFVPRLIKRPGGDRVPVQELSSGEKILMSLALCLYNSVENTHIVHFPKLLLLDEIDAPLHPSMTQILLTCPTNHS